MCVVAVALYSSLAVTLYPIRPLPSLRLAVRTGGAGCVTPPAALPLHHHNLALPLSLRLPLCLGLGLPRRSSAPPRPLRPSTPPSRPETMPAASCTEDPRVHTTVAREWASPDTGRTVCGVVMDNAGLAAAATVCFATNWTWKKGDSARTHHTSDGLSLVTACDWLQGGRIRGVCRWETKAYLSTTTEVTARFRWACIAI